MCVTGSCLTKDLTWVFPYCQSVTSHQAPATRKLAEAYLQCWDSSESAKNKVSLLLLYEESLSGRGSSLERIFMNTTALKAK